MTSCLNSKGKTLLGGFFLIYGSDFSCSSSSSQSLRCTLVLLTVRRLSPWCSPRTYFTPAVFQILYWRPKTIQIHRCRFKRSSDLCQLLISLGPSICARSHAYQSLYGSFSKSVFSTRPQDSHDCPNLFTLCSLFYF